MLRNFFIIFAFLPSLVIGNDIYLECERLGLYGHNTEWIDNACAITKKHKQYYKITNEGWNHIYRRYTTGGTFNDKGTQICGKNIESFKILIDRAKKSGKAINDEYYAGATRSEFFEEFSGEGVSSLGDNPVIFSENEITLKNVLCKSCKENYREVAEWEKINRLTGEVFEVAMGRNKVASCEPISKLKYDKVIKNWNDGFTKIQEAEQLKRKF